MIIPIKCFTCGMVIADKYRTYVRKVAYEKSKQHPNVDTTQTSRMQYLTKENVEKSVEGQVLDELLITRMCCRRHFLTHVDIL